MLDLFAQLAGEAGFWERRSSQAQDLMRLKDSWDALQSTKEISELFEAKIVSAFLEFFVFIDELVQDSTSLLTPTSKDAETIKKCETLEDKIRELQANEEVQRIQEFYDEEIKGKDAKFVLKLFSRMFRDITNAKLRKYLMESVSQVHALNFTFLCKLALFMCKETPEQNRLEFLFDVFTK